MPSKKATRRNFVRSVLATSAGAAIGSTVAKADSPSAKPKTTAPSAPEWRNKQPGMSYRQFGNSGFMVSEIIFGTTPWNDDSYLRIIESGREKGINYIDTAPAYSKGQSEKVIGKYFKQSGNRDDMFLSTKISFYDEYMNKISNGIFKDLSAEKQEALSKRADEMMAEREIMKPGYHFKYFGGQDKKFKAIYLRYLVFKEYGSLKKWKSDIQARMHELVDNSLQALNTDYLDVLHCPHGTAMPEELDDENIREFFDTLKAKGKIRSAALSMHNDVAANLEKAIDLGYYDAAMFAYNIANHASLDIPVRKAKEAGMGLVAMKVARIISNPNYGTIPQWRIEKLNAAIGEERSLQSKAYLWALQNPNLTCCVSEMPTPEAIADNVSITGRKVEIGLV